MTIHPYILRRLTQTNDTPNIVLQSTPVLGFGNFLTATVATLGLNPSRREFLSGKNKILLSGSKSRLESLHSLGLTSYQLASQVDHEKVLDRCLKYFQGQHSYGWFKRFSPILDHLGVSYREETACHLDLFQTATDPVWSGLSRSVRARYIENEGWFFIDQISSHQISKVLLNGRSVVNAFSDLLGVALSSSFHTGSAGQPFEFFTGQVAIRGRNIDVRGWNINIQSSPIKNGAPMRTIAELC